MWAEAELRAAACYQSASRSWLGGSGQTLRKGRRKFLLCILWSYWGDFVEHCARSSLEETERAQTAFHRHDIKLLLFVLEVWEGCFARLSVNRVQGASSAELQRSENIAKKEGHKAADLLSSKIRKLEVVRDLSDKLYPSGAFVAVSKNSASSADGNWAFLSLVPWF